MVLVDTSVWINYFRDRHSAPTARLRVLLDESRAFCVTGLIVQEIVQGAADLREFTLLEKYFSTQRMLVPEDPVRTHCYAARLYFACRRRGFTPRSTIDCFIAQIALEHEVPLLHEDRDFEQIAKVASKLKLA